MQIQNYLDSNTSFCTHFYIDKNKFYFYGIQIYNEVINRIEKVFNKHNAKNIYQFLSHKIMMCYRIRLLNKYKLIKNYTEIYDIFHEIVRLSTILENLQIKYIICKKLKILESAKNIFQKIKNLEYSGLHLLLKNL